MVRLAADEQAWMAALIDSEGCIHVTRRTRNNHGALLNPSYQLRICVSMVCRAMVARARELAGAGQFSQQKNGQWAWRIVAQQAASLIREIYPYMIEKRQQAALAHEITDTATRSTIVNGHQGFMSKSPELVELHANLYADWQTAQRRGTVEDIPTVPSPEEHSARQAIWTQGAPELEIAYVHSLTA